VLTSTENAVNRTNLVTLATLVVTVFAVGFRGLPRPSQLDELTLDLSVYCLVRFPPSDHI
jgi:hypothetical protein